MKDIKLNDTEEFYLISALHIACIELKQSPNEAKQMRKLLIKICSTKKYD